MRENLLITLILMLFTAAVVVLCLLMWSVNQSANLKYEAKAAELRVQELQRQTTELRAELNRIKMQDANSLSTDDSAIIVTGSQEQKKGELVETSVNEALTSDETDIASKTKIKDMTEPEKQPSTLGAATLAMANLNYEKAVEFYSEVNTSEPDYIEARLGVANAYFHAHEYDSAIKEFQNVIEHSPESVTAAIGLANSFGRTGRYAEQIETFDKIISLEPDTWLHYNGRAAAYLINGEGEKAIHDFLEATRLAAPDKYHQAKAMENIGLVYLSDNKWQDAYNNSENVNRLNKDNAWNWLIRGIASAKLERNIDAYVAFDEWFKLKRGTDPYLLKPFLPEELHPYVDVTAKSLVKLVDPPLGNGEPCENDYQCKSNTCRPGAPDNKSNYCVALDKRCAGKDTSGYILGEHLIIENTTYRCYQPESGNARWTRDTRHVTSR